MINEKPSLEEVRKRENIYVCVLCLESYQIDSYTEEDGMPTAYYLDNWSWKGNTVRVCYNCFHYSG